MFTVTVKSNWDEDICLLLKVANHSLHYLIDCGEAQRLSVKECQDTKAIFLSHTHIDHFINFDTILRHQIGTGRRVIICGPKGIIDQVQNRIKSYCWNLIQKGSISYEIREIQNQDKVRVVALNPPFWEQEEETIMNVSSIYKEKDFFVTFEILDHKTDSIAYVFQGERKIKIALDTGFSSGKWVAALKKAYQAGNPYAIIRIEGVDYTSKDLFYMIREEKGKKVGVILDHAASEKNHAKIKNSFYKCDEVYVECFYKDEDKDLAIKNYHSYAAMSGKIVNQCHIKKAFPVHFSRKYEESEVEELVQQFYKAAKS